MTSNQAPKKTKRHVYIKIMDKTEKLEPEFRIDDLVRPADKRKLLL